MLASVSKMRLIFRYSYGTHKRAHRISFPTLDFNHLRRVLCRSRGKANQNEKTFFIFLTFPE